MAHLDLARARRMLAGDREAFEKFFEDHFDAVFRFAVGRLGDESMAAEVVQSTFCLAVEKLAQADLNRKVWEPLERIGDAFSLRWLGAPQGTFGGDLLVATGRRPAA